MIEFEALSHINIVVDDINVASNYYEKIVGAIKINRFPNIRNTGFAKSLGFVENPENLDVTAEMMLLPGTNVMLELMCYHSGQGEQEIKYNKNNDMGGPRHICFKVKNIEKAFEYLKKQDDIRFANDSSKYKPGKVDTINTKDFHFFAPELENDQMEKQKVCNVLNQTEYFSFIDRYGMIWELEEHK